MDAPRLTLYRLAARHRLAPPALARLLALAGLASPPAAAARWAPRALGALAALLLGLGLVFWVAAHWESLGRVGRFALLQGAVLVACTAAWARPGAARAPLVLLALLGIGALFAHFGQTYQTGADAWQLFALWATLALPLALAARSDVVWAPWALVAMSAVALWMRAHSAHRWGFEAAFAPLHAAGWAMALALVAALSPAFARITGAGPWALRTAVTLAAIVVTGTALGALFATPIAPQYALGLAVLAAGGALLASRRAFDVYGLSAVALALDTLLVAGLGRLLFDGRRGGDPLGELLALGLAAAALLAGSVNLVLTLARRRRAEGLA